MGQWTLLRLGILGWYLLQALIWLTIFYIIFATINQIIVSGGLTDPMEIIRGVIPGL